MPGSKMTFKQRVTIQAMIEDPRTKSIIEIANRINMNRVTVYNEIINRRVSYGSKSTKFLGGHPDKCPLLKQFPFCCNACFKKDSCSKEILFYDAYYAEEISFEKRFNSQKGPRLTKEELKKLDECISPRVKAGQSLYHILKSTDEIKLSEQTIRRYINNNYLTAKVIDLPRTVQRRDFHSNRQVKRKTHIDVSLLYGRMFDDYILYKKQYPNDVVIQIDTVIGRQYDKKAVLTIYEPFTKLQIGLLVYKSSSTSVNNVLLDLIKKLESINGKFFDAILTDNGFEFKDLFRIAADENGVVNFKLFYCDPYSSFQKGGCERNHELFRYIKEKGTSLDNLTQRELDSIFSHINSLRRRSLGGLSPYQAFSKKYGYKILEAMNIEFIEASKIILKR